MKMWNANLFLLLFIGILLISIKHINAVREGWRNVYNDRGHPFIASVQYTLDDPSNPNASYNHICTGSLIFGKHVLTSANCFDDLNSYQNVQLAVNLGAVEKDTRDQKSQFKLVERKIIHPEYNEEDQRANIALLILKDPVRFSRWVQVIRPNPQKLSPEGQGKVYGWNGRLKRSQKKISKKLLMAQVSVLQRDECESYYPDLLDDQFCIGGLETSHAPCRGTPGIPYQQIGEDIYIPIVTGVATYWPEDCEGPALFTAVDKYTDFIMQYMQF